MPLTLQILTVLIAGLAAGTIPNMFRTATNVTGQMSAAVILARGERDGAMDEHG